MKSVVMHRHLSLIVCDSAGSLAEVLAHVDLTDIPHLRFGDKALALPSEHARMVRDALWNAGTFPRVVGEPAHLPYDSSEEE